MVNKTFKNLFVSFLIFDLLECLLIFWILGVKVTFSALVVMIFVALIFALSTEKILGIKTPKLRQDLQVFAYGFPYYRNWDEVAEYLKPYDLGFPFYTNDNNTVARFYLQKFKLYNGSNMFFVDVNNNTTKPSI